MVQGRTEMHEVVSENAAAVVLDLVVGLRPRFRRHDAGSTAISSSAAEAATPCDWRSDNDPEAGNRVIDARRNRIGAVRNFTSRPQIFETQAVHLRAGHEIV